MGWMELIDSGDPTDPRSVNVDVPAARYGFFQLVIEGTTTTAEILDPADVGNLRLQRFGKQKQGTTFEIYHDYSGIKGGFVEATTPTAGASRLVAYLPLSFPGIPNSLDVRSDEEIDIKLDFDAILSTRFGANPSTWSLYGFIQPAIPERYVLYWENEDIQSNGAGALPKTLSGQNIGALLLRDSAGVINTVQIEQDGATVISNISDQILLDLTNLENRVETSGNTLVEVNMAPSGLIAETRNRQTKITPQFSAGGTLTVFKLRVIQESDVEASLARVESFLDRRAAESASVGNGRPRGSFQMP